MIIKNGSLTITLDGKYGCGKTLTLVHAMNYALNNDFIIVYIPSGKWIIGLIFFVYFIDFVNKLKFLKVSWILQGNQEL